MTTPTATRVHVRMLANIGGHAYGDELWLTNRPLGNDHVAPTGVSTLVEAYVAAGYCVVIP